MAQSIKKARTFIRPWFYFIDHKGMLFLDEMQPKNYTTCLKDEKFLNFFFSNLRPNKVDEYNLKDSDISKEELKLFPFSSPCWGE